MTNTIDTSRELVSVVMCFLNCFAKEGNTDCFNAAFDVLNDYLESLDTGVKKPFEHLELLKTAQFAIGWPTLQ